MEQYENLVNELNQFIEDAQFVSMLEQSLNEDDIEDEFVTKKELAQTFDIIIRLIQKVLNR